MTLGVPGRLRPRIFSIFGTTRVVGRRPSAPAAFTPGEIPGTHFQWLSRSQGTWFCWKELWKKSQVTPPGIGPGTIRLIAQRLNYYATPHPVFSAYKCILPHCGNKELFKGPQTQMGISQQHKCDRFSILLVKQYFILNFKVPLRSS